MKCPYCNQDMKLGNIRPISPKASETVYWLPEDSRIRGLFISAEKIIACGGFVFNSRDEESSNESQTYSCDKCRILLTKLDLQ